MKAVKPLSILPLTAPDAPDAPNGAADVSQRISIFERTGDPQSLWPGLTERARVGSARELERITREVLAGSRAARIADSFDARALGVAGYTTGMGPVIGRWLEDGLVSARNDVATTFARHLEQGRRRAERIEREVWPVIDALLARGIPLLALKGFHVARTYYEEAGMRRQSDVDILIPSARVADAEAVLESARLQPAGPRNTPYKRDWIGNAVDPRFYSLELADARSKWMLEVHVSLDRSYHRGAVAHLDGERQRIEWIAIAGRRMQVLSPALLVVYLACHCSHELENTRLLRVFELVRVIRAEGAANRLDWNAVLALLERTKAAAFVFPAFALVEELAPGTVDARVTALARAHSTRAARVTVDRLAPAGGSLDERDLLRQVMWARNPVLFGQRLIRTLWPPSIEGVGDIIPVWKATARRFRAGLLSIRTPNERAR